MAKRKFVPAPLLLAPKQELRMDKVSLEKLCDSLVLENDYKKVINYCEPYVSDEEYKETVIPYLTAAYYFTSDSVQSKKMLAKLVSRKPFEEIILYLISSNVALIKYFDIAQNREPVIALALKEFNSTVNASRKQEGEQLIRFLINDQRIRKLKYAYSKEGQEVQVQLDRRLLTEDSIQNKNIYHFYKKQGRYFGEKEVGEIVSSMQLIFFSHITDVKLRQEFFKPLLEQAVKEGAVDKESLVNFILRTESFTNPEFWNTINDRLPEIRKQYGLPDNYLFTPF